MIRWK